LLSDEDVSGKNYNATIVERIVGKKSILLDIEEIGEAFLTKKFIPKDRKLEKGALLCVEISRHQSTERWLVSKIISINGELYCPQEPESIQEESNPRSNKGRSENKILFPGLDQRYVFNSSKGKGRKKIPIKYGLNLTSEKFLKSWQDNSYVKISDYSETFDVIPSLKESKFVGIIVSFNFFKGWQGFIYCESINSLVYVRHNLSRLSGSIVVGADVEFNIGIDIDNRGALQFVAKNWKSSVNRGDAPEPAIHFEFEEFKQSRPFIESVLCDSEQFLLITSSRVQGMQICNAEEIVNYVNKEYPKCKWQVLEWPRFILDDPKSGAPSGTGRFSHPLIANHHSAAVVLFPHSKGDEEE
jgi:hypothetical protein